MEVQEFLENMKKIHNQILNLLDKENNREELFHIINQEIQDQGISKNAHNFKTFLYMLSKILNNHYRYPNFFSKIEKIIQKYKTEIKQTFSNKEIYKIYEKCPKFLLFLFKEQIIELDQEIIDIMLTKDLAYLFPEYAFKHKIIVKIPENFEEKQKIGENDNIISQMIRQDSIDEFISYVNKNEYPLDSYIEKSIYETNDFLVKQNNTTLIEYATFFGSTQIFKYLCKKGVELKSTLWLYGIHSDNPEMIELLEENQVEPPNKSYEKCIKESIKCHHNDITNYILSNLMDDDIENIDNINFEEKYDENIYSYSFHYYNFSYFPKEINHKIIFYYACQYDYVQIVEFFLNTKEISIMEKIVYIIFSPNLDFFFLNNISPIKNAANNNNYEILNILMNQNQFKVDEECFKKCNKLRKITIPSSVTKIGKCAFYECSKLEQITIPSSVTIIELYAFYGCSSLAQISIPSSVNLIGQSAFNGCSSLKQITIPSSVTFIGQDAFSGCQSLTQVSIPSSVTLIRNSTFLLCSKLSQISIPSSITSIDKNAFRECSSLKQITIPSSVTSIGNNAFDGCSSLKKIKIPSSVTSIGDCAFYGCSSLTQISIPSSVTSIGDSAFNECSSLTQITIPSSVTLIGDCILYKCTSLKQITVPYSLRKRSFGLPQNVEVLTF